MGAPRCGSFLGGVVLWLSVDSSRLVIWHAWMPIVQPLYRSPRVWPLLCLGFGSGLLLAVTSTTLQACVTVEGVSLTQIGLLTLVGSAYTLKFLWAPLLDRFQLPFLGRRRGWMAATQLLLALSIMAMGFFAPSQQLGVLSLLALWVAFLSATQDIAFDAYSTDVLKPFERAAEIGRASWRA